MQLIFNLFLTLVFSALCTTAPVLDTRVAIPHKRDIPKLPYFVTNLGVFESNPNLGVQSSISFHFSDPNHTTKIEGDCLRSFNMQLGMGLYIGVLATDVICHLPTRGPPR